MPLLLRGQRGCILYLLHVTSSATTN